MDLIKYSRTKTISAENSHDLNHVKSESYECLFSPPLLNEAIISNYLMGCHSEIKEKVQSQSRTKKKDYFSAPFRKLSIVFNNTICSEAGRDSIFFMRRIIFRLSLSFAGLLDCLMPKSSSVVILKILAKRMIISGLNLSLLVSYAEIRGWVMPIIPASSGWVYPNCLRNLAIYRINKYGELYGK